LSEIYANLEAAQPSYLRRLAGALTPEDQQSLTSLMNTGLLLNMQYPNATLSENLTIQAQQILYGKLIPATWAIATDNQNPFIL
jgi:hypothetical protein